LTTDIPFQTKSDLHSAYYLGQPIDCLIKDVNMDSRSVSLKTIGQKGKEEPMRNSSIPFVALSPGMRFEMIVDKKVDVSTVIGD
jgi:hypothetical protein